MEEHWLRHALDLAERSARTGGGPFGAVIVRAGVCIAEGHNRVTMDADPTAHAEVVAIRAAGRALGSHVLEGCVLYTSCEPCPMCAGAIHWARLDQVWYAATREQAAAAGFDDALLHEDVRRPPEDRTVHTRRALPEASERPFDVWRSNPERVPY